MKNVVNIDEYIQWRAEWLKKPKGTLFESSRGPCIIGPTFIIEDTVRSNWHMKNRAIEDAEYGLILTGYNQPKAIKKQLYANDQALYLAYKKLKIFRLGDGDRTSRKNIITNPDCCLCYWQLFQDTLIVISRSWDVQRAGISDLVVANRIAHLFKCTNLRFITLNNHVYLDRDHIARPIKIK